ncbi:MAG: hypothetical protein CM1200mP2_51540 [Planctomycetaceae bacterium]|nr:MAG: hypothetical protein CM1200mP2_51540 [Planctomycetaceae bacterium]
MLRVTGRNSDRGGFCDRINRRRFLEVGSLGVFGLTLSDLLRAESRGSQHKSDKSVILIWQHGGPSQLDTFDMKPLAPSNIRGPYNSIASSLPGLRVGELLPYQAKIMDKVSVIRSFSHGNGDHWAAAHWMLTAFVGANGSDRRPRNPSMGACVSKLLGPRDPGVPATVNFNDGGFGFHGGAYLGVAHNPFRLGEFSYGNEAGRLPTADHKSFTLVDGLSKVRLGDRLGLSRQFDRFRRQVDESPVFDSIDEIDQQAVDILMSGKAKAAFELDREDKKTREKYGPGWGEQALLCRRLIEPGARLSVSTPDTGTTTAISRARWTTRCPATTGRWRADEDLAQRGMLENPLVVTPANSAALPRSTATPAATTGHRPRAPWWPAGLPGGQVIGTTDKDAAHPTSRKVDVADFCRIVYRGMA